MATYTNESLNKLYKKDLMPIVLSLQNKLDEVNNSKTELLGKIPKLNDKFDQFRSDVCITKVLTTYFQVDLLALNVNVGQMPRIQGVNA